MRLIDADLLQTHCAEQAADEWNKQASPYSWAHAYEAFSDDVDNAPTVDAVPVVRCKDCKHARPGHDEKYGEYWECTYTNLDQHFDTDHYCSYGERKGEESAERADT